MSIQADIPMTAGDQAAADEWTLSALGWVALLGAATALFAAVLGLVATIWLTAPAAVQDAWRFDDVVLLVIGLAASMAGLISAWLAHRAERAGQPMVAATCVALSLMAAFAGMAAGAIEMVGLWRYPQPTKAPIVLRIDPPSGAGLAVAAATAVPSKADADRGGKLFVGSCSACHGGGEGVFGVAPPVTSEWVSSRSDAELVTFIREGRAPGSPDTKTGRAMPAKGGNVSLTDADLADMAAHIRRLQSAGAAAPATAPADLAPTPAPLTAPRWVLSPPEGAPAALVANERTPLYPQAIAGVTRPAYEPGERDTAVLALGASAGLRIALLAAVLGLLMACLLSTGSSWPLPQLLRGVMGGWLAVLMMNVLLVAAWAALAAVR